ncbi:LOXH1 protein, partial [Rhodinocichla rosea]|nr:LOXH1 protein [Rhodinocichla rosea]
MVMVFYGSNGKSNPVSMENKVEHQTENQITYDTYVVALFSFLLWPFLLLPPAQSLDGSQVFSTVCCVWDSGQLCLPHADAAEPGQRWHCLSWGCAQLLPLVTYHLTVFSRNILNERNLVHMTACIYGTHGDTGDRSLLQSLQNVQQGEKNESFLVMVDAVDLEELEKIVLLISSKTDCKLDIKKLHVQEAVKEYPIYVFEVNEEFSMNPNKPKIQREIPRSFVIRGEKQKNDVANNLNKEGSKVKNLTEYTIKVHTGDKRGAGTDANVHIILFGNEDKSEVFQLSQSLEHQNPFERGKVDTFKIKTKNVGNLRSIEIGHDGKGFASGWFLEKVEITDAARNSVHCFNCNRSVDQSITPLYMLFSF